MAGLAGEYRLVLFHVLLAAPYPIEKGQCQPTVIQYNERRIILTMGVIIDNFGP
jgi:hypothetical protein